MVTEIMRALGLIAAGVLLALICSAERDDRDDGAWLDADWEQAEDREP